MLLALLAIAASPVEARQVLADFTPNPSAAQFRNVRAVGDVVCGEINPPNQTGGFNGFQPFVYQGAGDWVLDDGGSYRLKRGNRLQNTGLLAQMSAQSFSFNDFNEYNRLRAERDEAVAAALALLARCRSA